MDDPMSDDQILAALRAQLTASEGRCLRLRAAISILSPSSEHDETAELRTMADDLEPKPASAKAPHRTDALRAKERERKRQARAAKPAPSRRTNDRDWHAIAAAIKELRTSGQSVTAGLSERFGEPSTVVKNWPARCRSLGLLGDEPSFVSEPIGKLPVNEAQARDAAGGPRSPVPASGQQGFTPPPRPTPAAERALPFSVADAAAAIAGVA